MYATSWKRVGTVLMGSLLGPHRPLSRLVFTHTRRKIIPTYTALADMRQHMQESQEQRVNCYTTTALTNTGSAPRLLRASSYELVDPTKVAAGSGAYAILSHTWRLQQDEITFKDMSPETLRAVMAQEAFTKIRLTCEQATRDGLQYVWIDTCCIDKSSSADLSEAINSMYAWYASAKVCYVYMSDVELAGGQEAFRRSRWFTRAWTLQELLAPTELRFYDKDWRFLGRLSHRKCAQVVSEVTGIDTEMLLRKRNLADFSVAQRMSWAAHRHATRNEDSAYSLLGIFDVQMPMIYGEGQKAFVRLQEQIIRASTDHTIFCWSGASDGSARSRPLLAGSPSQFAGCSNLQQITSQSPRAYQMTNRGLEMTLPMRAYINGPKGVGLTRVKLNCATREDIEDAKCNATMVRPKSQKRVMLNLQRQYDLDAEISDGFKPWTGRLRKRWRDGWDDLMGRSFDYHFVSSHARRAYAVGHTSHGPRLDYTDDEPSMFREQTIVILRDCKDDGSGVATSSTSNPIASFNEVHILATLAFLLFLLSIISAFVIFVLLPDQEEEENLLAFAAVSVMTLSAQTEDTQKTRKPVQLSLPKDLYSIDAQRRREWFAQEQARLNRLLPPAWMYEDDPEWWAEERAELRAAQARLRALVLMCEHQAN